MRQPAIKSRKRRRSRRAASRRARCRHRDSRHQRNLLGGGRFDRAAGVRLTLLMAMVLATVTTELLATEMTSPSAGLLAQGFPFLNLGAAVATLLLMLFTTAKAAAATYYVRTTGDDGNSGTSAGAAWETFEKALDDTSAGDIVYFGAGTYNEAVAPSVDGTSGSPITFIADTDGSQTGDAGVVILDGAGTGDKGKDGNPMKIDKDEFLHFIGIKFVGNSKEGIKIKDAEGIVLEKCEIYDSSDGIKIEKDSGVTMINCLIHSNSKDGIEHKAKDKYAVTIMNCTIADNGEEGINQSDGDLVLTNSIIYGNGKHGLSADGDSAIHTYNLLYNNSDGNYDKTSQGTGEILVDPLFTSSSNYRPQLGSPAIDAGTSSGSPPSDDFDGGSRPAEGGYDIGCFEVSLGLVGHWKLDESSGTTATDSSGEGNDGTVTGTNFASSSVSVCPIGSTGLEVDGGTDYISVGNDSSLQFTDEFTVMAWIRGDSWGSGSDVDTIVRKGTTNPLNYAFSVVDGEVTLVLDGNDAGSGRFSGDTVLNVDRWYHVAAIWDGSEVKIYVNGVQDNSTTHSHSSTLGTDSRELFIGGHSSGDRFDGSIADVRIYDQAVAASYISSVYGLQAYYKFDESSGSTAADSSGYENDGTLVDSPTWRSTGGQIDGALEFSSTNSVDIPDPGVGSGPYSISVWIESDSLSGYSSSYGAGIARSTHGDIAGDWMLTVDNDGALLFYNWRSSGDDSDGVSYTANGTISANTWYHIVATWDGSTERIYVNGEEATITGTQATDSGWGTTHEIGQCWTTSDYQFDGLIDDVRIFNRELCLDEVENLYGEGTPGGIRVIKWLEVQ